MTRAKSIVIIGDTEDCFFAACAARQVNEYANIIVAVPSLSDAFSNRPSETFFEASVDERREDFYINHFYIDVRNAARAISLDIDARSLLFLKGGKKERVPFDELIYCGYKSHTNDFGLSQLNIANDEDIRKICDAKNKGANTAIVRGICPYGLYVADQLSAFGFDVSIIDDKKRVLPEFSLPFVHLITQKLKEKGIRVMLGDALSWAQGDLEHGFGLSFSSGQNIACDIFVDITNGEKNHSLLADAGAAIDAQGYVRVDDHMLTTLPSVYACGAAVELPTAVTLIKKPTFNSVMQKRTAEIAGFNAAIEPPIEKDSLLPNSHTIVIKVHDMYFARCGLIESDAKSSLTDDIVSSTVVAANASNRTDSRLTLVHNKNGQILGAEMAGFADVLRTMDLIGIAVINGFSVGQLMNTEIASIFGLPSGMELIREALMRAFRAHVKPVSVASAEKLALWLKTNQEFFLLEVDDEPQLFDNHVKKPIHLPLATLQDKGFQHLPSDSPIVIYSRSGFKSYLAETALVRRGIKSVYHLDGGRATLDLVAKERG